MESTRLEKETVALRSVTGGDTASLADRTVSFISLDMKTGVNIIHTVESHIQHASKRTVVCSMHCSFSDLFSSCGQATCQPHCSTLSCGFIGDEFVIFLCLNEKILLEITTEICLVILHPFQLGGGHLTTDSIRELASRWWKARVSLNFCWKIRKNVFYVLKN